MKNSKTSKKSILTLATLLFFAALFLCADAARAATITVRSSADAGGTCPGATCTLRQAIATSMSGDTIDFDMTSVTSPIVLASQLTIDSKSITIQGPGASVLTISGNNAVRVFEFNSTLNTPLSPTISGLTIANGSDAVDNRGGAGILNTAWSTATINDCVITNNHTGIGGQGGGVYVVFSPLTINNSVISGNSASVGGGVYSANMMTINNSTISGNNAGQNGGISIQQNTTNINNSTISGNTANGGAAGIGSGGTLNVTDSTISGNTSSSGGSGGIANSGTLTLTGDTISANSGSTLNTSDAAGGVFTSNGAASTVRNTIIAGNTAINPDVVGAFTSQGFNLIGVSDGSTGFTNGANSDQVGTAANPIDPMLEPLASNGGATQTMALKPNSPAIDKGNSFGLTGDQRGSARPIDLVSYPNAAGGDGADIGAFELQQAPTAASVSISGRVLSPQGRGVMNALIVLTEEDGTTRYARTSFAGRYQFNDVAGGTTVVIRVVSKRYRFAPQVVAVTGEDSDVNFRAE